MLKSHALIRLREPRLLSAPGQCSQSHAPLFQGLAPCPASVSHSLFQLSSEPPPTPPSWFGSSSLPRLLGPRPPDFVDHAPAPPQASWPYPYLVTGGPAAAAGERYGAEGDAERSRARRVALGAERLLRALRAPGNNGGVRAGRAAAVRAAGAGSASDRRGQDRRSG